VNMDGQDEQDGLVWKVIAGWFVLGGRCAPAKLLPFSWAVWLLCPHHPAGGMRADGGRRMNTEDQEGTRMNTKEAGEHGGICGGVVVVGYVGRGACCVDATAVRRKPAES